MTLEERPQRSAPRNEGGENQLRVGNQPWLRFPTLQDLLNASTYPRGLFPAQVSRDYFVAQHATAGSSDVFLFFEAFA